MDRLETTNKEFQQAYVADLYSSMDRLETQVTKSWPTVYPSFIFQYG